jgi:hypothetical protein
MSRTHRRAFLGRLASLPASAPPAPISTRESATKTAIALKDTIARLLGGFAVSVDHDNCFIVIMQKVPPEGEAT